MDCMHKETVVAVIIGLLFGLLVAVSIYKLQSLKNNNDISTSPNEQMLPSTTPANKPQDRLTIEFPTQGLVTTASEITITGKTEPEAFLVLFAHDSQTIFDTDTKGEFSIPLSLKEGPNFITLTVANQDGATYSVNRLVVYEKELPLENSPEASKSAG